MFRVGSTELFTSLAQKAGWSEPETAWSLGDESGPSHKVLRPSGCGDENRERINMWNFLKEMLEIWDCG